MPISSRRAPAGRHSPRSFAATRRSCDRSAAIKEVAESAPHEPDAAAVVEHGERLRRDGLTQIVGLVSDRFGLRAGLAGDDATDLLMMLSSSGTYLTLRRYGWSEEKYAAWLTDTLAMQLLAQPGRRGKVFRVASRVSSSRTKPCLVGPPNGGISVKSSACGSTLA